MMTHFDNLSAQIKHYAEHLEKNDIPREVIAADLKRLVEKEKIKRAENMAAEAEKYDGIVPF